MAVGRVSAPTATREELRAEARAVAQRIVDDPAAAEYERMMASMLIESFDREDAA